MIAAMKPASLVDRIVDGVRQDGYAILPHVLDDAAIAAMRAHARDLDAAGAFIAAQTGRDPEARATQVSARGDRILWLDAAAPDPTEAPVLALVEQLRVACNRSLFLGIAEHELHYAIYPPGSGYARHRDRFRDDDARVLSLVLYLNDDWREAEGGALRLHLARSGAGDGGAHLDVMPRGGTLVAFLSDTFEHEVQAAARERMSVTGWLRRRPLQA